ncbi:hypothetical protein AAL_06125 [Moelleriella libera RCEF 2490]|uniref:LEA domain protein n=1 Tax=Moelleriella libera RCEF 2490 TaxID=1081109 RepID=A0A167ZD22_9HYPO|nr:hypothetical protein AAL_06125 [Moelleriella libera RCEF 2490]
MSFLTERSLRSALPVARRALAVRQTALPRRAFSTSLRLRKSPADSVKDGLKTVDRAVTDNVVLPGLEAAAAAGSKVKEGAETVAKGSKGDVDELKGQATGKAEELKGKAKGSAAELQGKAKGAAEEAKSKL